MNGTMRKILMGIFAVILVYSLIRIVMIQQEYRMANTIYEESRTEYLHALDQTEGAQNPETLEDANKSEADFPDVYADIKGIQQKNPDVIGWIWIPDTSINYPILQGKDNQRYLNLSYDQKRSISGSIFMDYRNASDFSDNNSILYGHNMKNETMFGGLKRYLEQDYMRDHSYLYLFKEQSIMKYHIFAAYKTQASSKSYVRTFQDPMNFESYLAYVHSCINDQQLDAPVQETPLILLSTCTSVNMNERLVVHAAFVSEKEIDS